MIMQQQLELAHVCECLCVYNDKNNTQQIILNHVIVLKGKHYLSYNEHNTRK